MGAFRSERARSGPITRRVTRVVRTPGAAQPGQSRGKLTVRRCERTSSTSSSPPRTAGSKRSTHTHPSSWPPAAGTHACTPSPGLNDAGLGYPLSVQVAARGNTDRQARQYISRGDARARDGRAGSASAIPVRFESVRSTFAPRHTEDHRGRVGWCCMQPGRGQRRTGLRTAGPRGLVPARCPALAARASQWVTTRRWCRSAQGNRQVPRSDIYSLARAPWGRSGLIDRPVTRD
jgi:hypothetical protein